MVLTPLFLDVDLDGWEDVLISNGHELDMMDADIIQQSERIKAQKARPTQRELLELRRLFPRLATPNAAFRNGGNLAFTDVSKAWRFDLEAVTHGMAAGDLDGDGDLDIVQNNLNAPPTLLRNDAPAPRIAVRASALGANRHGIGARIRVTGGPAPVQTQVLLAGGRYLSSDQPLRTFAAAPDSRHTVELQWPSGRHQIVSNVPPDTLVEVTESPDDPGTPPPAVPAKPWMEDLSSRLNHVAIQSGFDDFARQRLLPWSGAYPSPGVTWADLDG
ncbi:MAG: ASPIC/UnbV domain-containing protein, partial [Verrucomicrobiota bacterium]